MNCKILYLICFSFYVHFNFGQMQTKDYSYLVLDNTDVNFKPNDILECNNMLVLSGNNSVKFYDLDGNTIHELTFPAEDKLVSISVNKEKLYVSVLNGLNAKIIAYDDNLNVVQRYSPEFRFTDFEKLDEGFIFYNSKITQENKNLIIITDNKCNVLKEIMEYNEEFEYLIAASNRKLLKRDGNSVCFNLHREGKIVELGMNGESSVLFDIVPERKKLNFENLDVKKIEEISKNTPILTYSISGDYLLFYNQVNGNSLNYYNRATGDYQSKPSSVRHDLIERFDFQGLHASAYLSIRNQFVSIMKCSDVEMIKNYIQSPSKAEHLPLCDSNDIVLRFFQIGTE